MRADAARRTPAGGEFTFGLVLGTLILVVQLLLYTGAVLAVPLIPFLLVLSTGPAVLLFGLVIVGASKLLAVFGLR